MDMQKYLDLFVSEAGEHIQAGLRDAERLTAAPPSAETLNSLFRHFHSIKGMAASMGFDPIASLSHDMENLLDAMRKGAEPPGDLRDVAQETLDTLSAMVSWAARGPERGECETDTRPLAEKIRARTPTSPAAGRLKPRAQDAVPDTATARYECRMHLDSAAELPGARAALALQRLETIGRIVSCTPPRENLGRSDFRGAVAFELVTDRPEQAILAAVGDLPDIQRLEVEPASPGGSKAEQPADPGEGSVRVSTGTLDRCLDSIAELMTRRGALFESLKTPDTRSAQDNLDRISESIRDLREQVMAIRLMPFDHIAPRLGRALRDVCRRTGKRASLSIAGGDVALDRSVLEEILDPLSHILRNAVDHGIDLPAERALQGKKAEGSVQISVVRSGDRVLIAVEDDGRGMDREAIERSALAGGFVTQADLSAMDEQQILLLTTIPGFSTASKVTEISGRGVGMDIVRTRIEALHGHMRISSQRGRGTRIELSLPLTVAVLDAFLVKCEAGRFAVPAGAVTGVELVEPERIRSTVGGRYLAPRGSRGGEPSSAYLPLVSLGESLGALAGGRAGDAPIHVLAYQADGVRGALAVDEVLQRREVVVKPLGPPLERLRRYSGAALLDDGSVALILDLVNLSRI